MSRVMKRGAAKAEMNMTPLIDVTFQLIVFFMLVNNIIAEEAVEMIVPNLENPKTQEMGEIERVTVNVSPMPYDRKDRMSGEPLNFEGAAAFVKIGMDQMGTDELQRIAEELKASQAANPNIVVLLRADAALYYQSVQPVMDAINAAGISTVNLVAAMPEDTSSPSSSGEAASE